MTFPRCTGLPCVASGCSRPRFALHRLRCLTVRLMVAAGLLWAVTGIAAPAASSTANAVTHGKAKASAARHTKPQPLIADPLNSPRWADIVGLAFGESGAPRLVWDERIRVLAPTAFDNPMQIPVVIDARALLNALAPSPNSRQMTITEMRVFADFNPVPLVLRFFPDLSQPYLGFRMKLQQSSPVRVAVQTSDGVWHVNGQWISTSGGGCTLPSKGRANTAWQQTLNRVSARLWPQLPASVTRADAAHQPGQRLRFSLLHPMDTGFAPGIPRFILERLQLADAGGKPLARLQLFEPVSENPVFSLNLPASLALPLHLSGEDNNGNPVDQHIATRTSPEVQP